MHPEVHSRGMHSTLQKIYLLVLPSLSSSVPLFLPPFPPSLLIQGLFQPRMCVNAELLSLGLATLENAPRGFCSNKEHSAFLREMGRAEEEGRRRGEGVWRGSEYESLWRRVARRLRLK